MGMPITANIIHTAKQIVNAKVLDASTMTGFFSCGSMLTASLSDCVQVHQGYAADWMLNIIPPPEWLDSIDLIRPIRKN